MPSNSRAVNAEDYDITGGVSINSLNAKQIQARLEVFKRKFCKECVSRYDCTYATYVDCKGNKPK